MRIVVVLAGACALALVTGVGAAFVACGSSSNQAAPGSDGGGVEASSGACVACVTDNDCNGGACVQIAGDTYCAPRCPNGNECSADRACAPVTTASGDQVSACVPRGDVCGQPVQQPDAGAPSQTCGSLVGPDVSASCKCASGQQCGANGCYGGWWCNTKTNRCQQPPAACTSADGGTPPGVPYDAGGPVTGNVGADGGTASRLFFAIVGDTRPASIDDTNGYPTTVINDIFAKIGGMNPMPPFLVSTGDYMFASTTSGQAAPQLDMYLAARSKYPGIAFPTMGNHECNGFTASNCGQGNADGVTDNYTQFVAKMLAPIGKSDPSYEIDIDAPDGSWTSKFLFVAGNAWSAATATWLDQAMARATTYTFVIRHEPDTATTAPGVSASLNIMSKHPYTLAITGHTHTYAHAAGSKQIIVGNGGAPLTGGKNYGFGMVSQRPDGTLDVDMIDNSTLLADSAFHFAVKPDGTPSP